MHVHAPLPCPSQLFCLAQSPLRAAEAGRHRSSASCTAPALAHPHPPPFPAAPQHALCHGSLLLPCTGSTRNPTRRQRRLLTATIFESRAPCPEAPTHTTMSCHLSSTHAFFPHITHHSPWASTHLPLCIHSTPTPASSQTFRAPLDCRLTKKNCKRSKRRRADTGSLSLEARRQRPYEMKGGGREKVSAPAGDCPGREGESEISRLKQGACQ